MRIYKYRDHALRVIEIYQPAVEDGITITSGVCRIPDDEIPALVSALQDYMSRRAKAITAAAKNGC